MTVTKGQWQRHVRNVVLRERARWRDVVFVFENDGVTVRAREADQDPPPKECVLFWFTESELLPRVVPACNLHNIRL